jgi:FkbM family methyltransferase
MRNDQPALMELNKSTNLYEILIRRLNSLRCRPGDVCVDAGANQGNHAIPMALAVAPTGVIHAFEPIKHLANRLRKMASDRQLPIHVYEIALSDRVGVAQFQFVKNVPGWSGLYDREYTSAVEIERIEVEVSTLDTVLLQRLNKFRFYKLDIEAAEFKALKGSTKIIAKLSPLIAFENGFGRAAKIAGHSKEEWFAFFASVNYRTFDLYGYEITPDRWPDHGQPYNSIAAARGSDDEKFIETVWRSEVDTVISAVRSGALKYGPL